MSVIVFVAIDIINIYNDNELMICLLYEKVWRLVVIIVILIVILIVMIILYMVLSIILGLFYL